MNFCFITLLKQIHSKKTCGIPLRSNATPGAQSLSLALFFFPSREIAEEMPTSNTSHFSEGHVFFFSLLLTMDRSARLLISKAPKPH